MLPVLFLVQCVFTPVTDSESGIPQQNGKTREENNEQVLQVQRVASSVFEGCLHCMPYADVSTRDGHGERCRGGVKQSPEKTREGEKKER